MKNVLLLIFIFLILATSVSAGEIEELKLRIADLDSQIKYLNEDQKRATGGKSEQIIYDLYYLHAERIDKFEDYYEATIADEDKLVIEIKKLDNFRRDLDRWHENAIEIAKRSAVPTVSADSLNVAEVKRGYGYVTYSIRLDVENPGLPGKVYVEVKGKRYDGHILDNNSLSGDIDGDSSATLTATTTIKSEDALNITKWEIEKINFYPK